MKWDYMHISHFDIIVKKYQKDEKKTIVTWKSCGFVPWVQVTGHLLKIFDEINNALYK